ncbi:predicted protein [Aspergillus terreus NIH2624]|uniref:Uncharacterized protein n=1 Tax=Aspergillus terreus (strain NIH 2624 / FGSC A1156) TaxID=341663 RepID=Q0CT07_ASPTN|nr:uncharacterized protein ATEG_03177 [Aspergillus terreus NIH2624]EAU36451.1 predicted protein [Aspergillus terreus NIH2624]
MASTSTSTSTSTTSTAVATATTATATASTGDTHLHLSANFAHNPQTKSPPIGYDHEVYLQLLAGREGAVQKTPNQIYREERARRRTTRALDPAILDPQGDPSPVDFECAENQGVKERLRG